MVFIIAALAALALTQVVASFTICVQKMCCNTPDQSIGCIIQTGGVDYMLTFVKDSSTGNRSLTIAASPDASVYTAHVPIWMLSDHSGWYGYLKISDSFSLDYGCSSDGDDCSFCVGPVGCTASIAFAESEEWGVWATGFDPPSITTPMDRNGCTHWSLCFGSSDSDCCTTAAGSIDCFTSSGEHLTFNGTTGVMVREPHGGGGGNTGTITLFVP